MTRILCVACSMSPLCWSHVFVEHLQKAQGHVETLVQNSLQALLGPLLLGEKWGQYDPSQATYNEESLSLCFLIFLCFSFFFSYIA